MTSGENNGSRHSEEWGEKNEDIVFSPQDHKEGEVVVREAALHVTEEGGSSATMSIYLFFQFSQTSVFNELQMRKC